MSPVIKEIIKQGQLFERDYSIGEGVSADSDEILNPYDLTGYTATLTLNTYPAKIYNLAVTGGEIQNQLHLEILTAETFTFNRSRVTGDLDIIRPDGEVRFSYAVEFCVEGRSGNEIDC